MKYVKPLISVACIVLFLLVININAFAFSYQISREVIVPWGNDYCEVYTDIEEYDWDRFPDPCPIFTDVWDAYEDTVYIIDDIPNFYEGTEILTAIEINMITGQMVEYPIPFEEYTHNISRINFIGSQDVKFSFYGPGHGALIFSGCDYNMHKIWEFSFENRGSGAGTLRSELYRLNNDLWGVVLHFFGAYPGEQSRYELRKYDIYGNLAERTTIFGEDDFQEVFDITPEGVAAITTYTDVYDGVFSRDGLFDLVRRENGQEWVFDWYEHPIFVLEVQHFPYRPFIPQYDGTVYSFEYTDAGIRIRRYELIIPPVADFVYYPMQGQPPLSITFLNYSCDEDGEIVRIECDWNGIHETIEGNPSMFVHQFTEPGNNPFTLTVVDNDEQTDSWMGSVYVE